MDQNLGHDVVILGAGLAGLRAAVEIARRTGRQGGHRHRVEGAADARALGVRGGRHGRGAANGPEGDSPGAARLGHGEGRRLPGRPGRGATGSWTRSPREIFLLDHWGMPLDARRGRPHRAAAVRRALLPAGHAGGRQDGLLRDADAVRPRCSGTTTFTRYDEFFVSDILVAEGDDFAGLAGSHARGHRRAGGDPRQGAADRVGRRRDAVRLHDVLAERSRATAWRWPIGPGCRWRTWSFCNSTPPVSFLRESS